MQNSFIQLLQEGDLRTTGKVKTIISKVRNQQDFDRLFEALHAADRGVVMRAADAIEKISVVNPGYLQKHKSSLIQLLAKAENIELKWHLAQLIPRLQLNNSEVKFSWDRLYTWAEDKKESRIVRVNSLQALFEIAAMHTGYLKPWNQLIKTVKKEKAPSLLARIKKLERNISKREALTK